MRIERLRHLIWNGYHQEARNELFGMRHLISEVAYMNGEAFLHAENSRISCGLVEALVIIVWPSDGRSRINRLILSKQHKRCFLMGL